MMETTLMRWADVQADDGSAGNEDADVNTTRRVFSTAEAIAIELVRR